MGRSPPEANSSPPVASQPSSVRRRTTTHCLSEPLLGELRDEIDVLRVDRPPGADVVVGIEGVVVVEIQQGDGEEAETKLLEVDGRDHASSLDRIEGDVVDIGP